jgi:hypothetical protein
VLCSPRSDWCPTDASSEAELADAVGCDDCAPPTPAAERKLRVTALDSGTYPMDGGGVATCRQIVLEGLPDVVWSCQAEIANDLKQARCCTAPCPPRQSMLAARSGSGCASVGGLLLAPHCHAPMAPSGGAHAGAHQKCRC